MQWFDIQTPEPIRQRLSALLADPATSLWNRGGNRFRSEMVEAGYQFVHQRNHHVASHDLTILQRVIEMLHLGSLIIDDIQDSSQQRRGMPSLHETHGIGQAISVGNWLYFRSLRELDDLELDATNALAMARMFHQGVCDAHHGQALDIGTVATKVAREELTRLVREIARCKSGSLTMLAIGGAALIADANRNTFKACIEFGYEFGRLLQHLNDLGNVIGKFDKHRRFEDFTNLRVTFVWLMASDLYGDESYNALMRATEAIDKDTSHLRHWLAQHDLRRDGIFYLRQEYKTCKQRIFPNRVMDFEPFDQLFDRIVSAYE